MGVGADLVKAEIIAAAVDRQRAQKLLEQGVENLEHTWTMRQRQRAVNQADRRIAAATERFMKQFPAEIGPAVEEQHSDT